MGPPTPIHLPLLPDLPAECMPIHVAAALGRVESLETLLASGFGATQQENEQGFCPLIIAAAVDAADCVRELLAAGANVEHRTSQGRTALFTAALCGHYQSLKHIIAAGADVSLIVWVGGLPRGGLVACMFVLPPPGIAAVLYGCTSTHLRWLFWGDAHPHPSLQVPAHDCSHTHPPTPQVNAVEDVRLYSPLLTVIARTSELDGKEGGEQDPTAATFLDCCALLIAGGANVNLPAKDGRTPLHAAAMAGSVTCTALLLQSGADINAVDAADHTPLAVAVAAERSRAVMLLVSKGADVRHGEVSGRGHWRGLSHWW